MSSGWSPDGQSLEQLGTVLAQSTSPDNAIRASAKQALEDAKHQPDLNNYLACLISSSQCSANVRASAGILLKNNVRYRYRALAADSKDYIREQVFNGVVDQDQLIRRVSGNIISNIFATDSTGGSEWPELFPRLVELIEKGDSIQVSGAIVALANVCEDSSRIMNNKWVELLVPKLLEFTASSNTQVKSQAIFCLCQFLLTRPDAVLRHIDNFLGCLFHLASESNEEIRKNICMAFVMLLETNSEVLLPHLDGVVNFCLHCMKDENDELSVEGAEFMLALAESPVQNIEPFLERIVPILLTCMVYSEVDRFFLENQREDDSKLEDKPEDIRPHMAKAKQHIATKKSSDGTEVMGHTSTPHDSEEDHDSDTDDDDDEDESDLSEWNLRKCSAAALDVFSTKYPGPIFQLCMPHLTQAIASSDWAVREAAILALGAIEEGCLQTMSSQGHVGSIIPYLVERTHDEFSPVRQIACWTLSRYSSWIVEQTRQTGNMETYEHSLRGLVTCCLDRNKRVQEAACSAVATFTEASGAQLLIPYADAVIQQLATCVGRYKIRNLTVLYDAIQTVVDALGESSIESNQAINNAVSGLWSPLLSKWQEFNEMDIGSCPLVECLGALATVCAYQLGSEQASALYGRAIQVVHDCLLKDQAHQNDPNEDPSEPDLIVTCLDLLDGMVQGLKQDIVPLFNQPNQPAPFLELLHACFVHSIAEVRQSAFALLGDMSMCIYQQAIAAHVGQFISVILPYIDFSDPTVGAVCNNAIWAFGEIAWRCSRQDMQQYADNAIERILKVLGPSSEGAAAHSGTVFDNAAIALGRLGQCVPDLVAPHLPNIIDRWCEIMVLVEETEEKDSSFQGMCHIVAVNPAGLSNEQSLLHFVHTIALYMDPSPNLAMLFAKLLEGYKSYVTDWDGMVMSKLDAPIATSLRQRYGF